MNSTKTSIAILRVLTERARLPENRDHSVCLSTLKQKVDEMSQEAVTGLPVTGILRKQSAQLAAMALALVECFEKEG